MVIVDKFNCAFMLICKSGSSSLTLVMAEEIYDAEYIQSQKAEHGVRYNGFIRRKLQEEFAKHPCDPKVQEQIKNYFKFAFVKNPWHRIVSACLQFRRWIDNKVDDDETFRFYDLMNRDYSFENFVHFVKNVERNHTERINHHWKPQVEILKIEVIEI